MLIGPLTERQKMSKPQPGPGAPIAAAPNMRDLGGWPARGDRRVRYGMIYRSAALNELQGDGESKLSGLGIRSIYDLRVDEERRSCPDILPPGVAYFVLDVLEDDASAAPAQLARVHTDPELAERLLGGGKAVALFEQGYRQIVTMPSALQNYGRLFADLAREERLPALFHCTGGKDRTGWAAACALMLLGVPDEVVMREYMLTNDQLLPAKRHVFEQFEAMGGDPELLMTVFGVREEFLDAARDEMRKRFGTIEGYFTEGLGLGAKTLKTLRETLTEGLEQQGKEQDRDGRDEQATMDDKASTTTPPNLPTPEPRDPQAGLNSK
jgi:protein-tyrosine phosphatase